MTEQEAHDLLHSTLPHGTAVVLSRSLLSRSIVGVGPVVHAASSDWLITIMRPDGELDAVSAPTLENAVQKVLKLLGTSQFEKPPKLAAPTVGASERQVERQVS